MTNALHAARCPLLIEKERRVPRQVYPVQGRTHVKKKRRIVRKMSFFIRGFHIFHISHCGKRITHLPQGHLLKGFAVLTIKIATNDTLKGTSHPI